MECMICHTEMICSNSLDMREYGFDNEGTMYSYTCPKCSSYADFFAIRDIN